MASLSKINGSDSHLLRIGERSLYVSSTAAVIIQSLKNGDEPTVILRQVNQHRFPLGEISQDQLDYIIKNNIAPLDLAREESSDFKTPIKFRMVLLREQHFEKIVHLVKPIYSSLIFYLTLLSLFTLTVWWCFAHGQSNIHLPFYGYVAIAACIFIIAIFHELGHTSAANRFEIGFKEIGIGMYLIFPTFYADVTDVWKLKRSERVIVNLAGMHAQLILNLLFIVACNSIDQGLWFDVLNNLIWINSSIILVNLNPFLKFDGYWVFSDTFNIPNLRLTGNKFLKDAWKKPTTLIESAWTPLFWYSMGSVIFFIFVITILLVSLSHTFITKPILLLKIFELGNISTATVPFLELAFAFFITSLILIKLYKFCKNIFNRNKN